MKKKSVARRKRQRRVSKKKVRFAVAGLGYIAQSAVLPAFQHAKHAELTALISSDEEKLKKLGKKYGVSRLFLAGDYEECLASGQIDAVYLAVPNSMHATYTIAAARAGVHVLCEKPMAISPQECEEMVEECDDANVKLMIAYRLHFEKANLKAIEACRAGKLGDLKLFSSTFSYGITDKNNIRLKDHLGGGPLFDLGIYCINAARYIFQSEPTHVFAMQVNGQDSRFREVEETVAVTLRFPEGRVAQFLCSFGGADASHFEVVGSKGVLKLDPAFDFQKGLKQSIVSDHNTKTVRFRKSDQFGPELDYFSQCVLAGTPPEPSGLEGLIDVSIIDAIYESIERRMPVALPQLRKDRRPTLELVKQYPPVSHETLFHAVEPST